MDNAQGRAARARSRSTAWARRVITLVVLAAGLWSVTANRAEAGTAPIVRQFTCPLPIVGRQSVTISVARPALDTATVGVPTPRLLLTATAAAAAVARLVVSFLGAEWAEGTGTMAGEVDTPQGTVKKNLPFTVPRTDVATGSGPLSIPGFGTLPSMTFSRPGDGEILVTEFTFRLSLLNSGGGQTFMSPLSITCTLASGPSSAVASFHVLSAGSPSTSPSPDPTTSSPAPRPTPMPSHVTRSPTPRPSPTPTRTRKSVSHASSLLWPAGMVGGLSGLGGGAWWLLRRRLAQRPVR